MELQANGFVLRPWRPGDEESLARIADNRKIWRNMSDMFPHPYTLQDAKEWIAQCRQPLASRTDFAIEYRGEPIGSAGFWALPGNARVTAELGYWLGEPFWGRGIATEAVRCLSRHIFDTCDFVRLQARVFEWNPASARVLEKAGFHREARLERSIVKDGRIIDVFLYVLLR